MTDGRHPNNDSSQSSLNQTGSSLSEQDQKIDPIEIEDAPLPRDPEAASRALVEVQALLVQIHDSPAARASLLERLRDRLVQLHSADVAYILEAIPIDDRLVVWDLVRAERDGDILVEVSESVRENLIASMDRDELVAAAETLDTDDLADIAADLPIDVVEEVRRGLNPEEREQLRAAMSYGEDTVGARMDFDMVTMPAEFTVQRVLAELRRLDRLPDHTDQIFIVASDDTFLGVLPFDRILVNEPEVLVEDLIERETMTLQALDEVSEAAQAFERYDLVSAPVVDPHGRLVGRLTVAEVVDVIREEGESDVLNKAGLREEEDLFASLWASAKNRWLWLGVNLCTAFFVSRVIGAFEGTIEKVVALAALAPIVAGIAGNSGNQTMTLFIRSLALGQVNRANAKRLLSKELLVAGFNGLVWGTIAGAVAWFLYKDIKFGWLLGVTLMLAMILNLLVGALIGMLVPLVLERLGRDPAVGSSVLLTFGTDSMGYFIFFALASLFF
jgi:magnesium transporter